MTTAQNPVATLDRTVITVTCTSDQTINEGDLVYWDGTNYTAAPLTDPTQVASNFLGVAASGNVPGLYPNDPTLSSIQVIVRGLVSFNSTTGETYNPYDAVTVGSDSQTIIKRGSSSSNRIGFVEVPPPSSARAHQATPVPESIAGPARLHVRLEPKHPLAVAV